MPCCGMLCGWGAPGLLRLRPHHGLHAAQTFLVLMKCPGHDSPGGDFSGAGPSRALVCWRRVVGSGCVCPVINWFVGKVTAQPAGL